MLTRFARLLNHPLFPLLILLAANGVFYMSLATAFA